MANEAFAGNRFQSPIGLDCRTARYIVILSSRVQLTVPWALTRSRLTAGRGEERVLVAAGLVALQVAADDERVRRAAHRGDDRPHVVDAAQGPDAQALVLPAARARAPLRRS